VGTAVNVATVAVRVAVAVAVSAIGVPDVVPNSTDATSRVFSHPRARTVPWKLLGSGPWMGPGVVPEVQIGSKLPTTTSLRPGTVTAVEKVAGVVPGDDVARKVRVTAVERALKICSRDAIVWVLPPIERLTPWKKGVSRPPQKFVLCAIAL